MYYLLLLFILLFYTNSSDQSFSNLLKKSATTNNTNLQSNLSSSQCRENCSLEDIFDFLDSISIGGPTDGIGLVDLESWSCGGNSNRWLSRGAALLHSFWPFEAMRAFRESLREDSSCAIAYYYFYLSLTWDKGVLISCLLFFISLSTIIPSPLLKGYQLARKQTKLIAFNLLEQNYNNMKGFKMECFLKFTF
jgi:hypothetical protein